MYENIIALSLSESKFFQLSTPGTLIVIQQSMVHFRTKFVIQCTKYTKESMLLIIEEILKLAGYYSK